MQTIYLSVRRGLHIVNWTYTMGWSKQYISRKNGSGRRVCVCVLWWYFFFLSFLARTYITNWKRKMLSTQCAYSIPGVPLRERERERGGGDTHVDVADRTALILHRRWPLVSVGCMFACSHSICLYYTQRDAYKKIKTPKSKKQHFHVQK